VINLPLQRLQTQRLHQSTFATPAEVVQYLGAVQAQEYPAAKWALGLRLPGTLDRDIDAALDDGSILRTHILRPTWHFVTPRDIRWMLRLTAPRIHALSAYYYRQAELDDALFARTDALLAKALEGGKQLTRAELVALLEPAGIANLEQRFMYIAMHAELEGVICSGGRRGKQMTCALLAERAPDAIALSREESLAELARRYFTGHGPAALPDYVWWSGLTVADARAGLEMVKGELLSETIGAETYWFAEASTLPAPASPDVLLLPAYDEYIVGYTDRSAIFETPHVGKLDSRGNVLFNYTILIDGQVVGTWKRTIKPKAVLLEITPFRPFSAAEHASLAAAARRYGDFLGLPAQIKEQG
jgi:hypothetical protein